MKIALIMRGPIRPSIESAIGNFNEIKSLFKNHDLSTFLFSWRHENENELSKLFDNIILMKEIDSDFARDNFKARSSNMERYPKSWTPENAYKQYWSMKQIAGIIEGYRDFDMVCFSRLDLEIKIDQKEIDLILENHNLKYYMPNAKGLVFYNVCDVFGICRPEVFKKVWAYENIEQVNSLFNKCDIHEEYVSKVLALHNIEGEFFQVIQTHIRR